MKNYIFACPLCEVEVANNDHFIEEHHLYYSSDYGVTVFEIDEDLKVTSKRVAGADWTRDYGAVSDYTFQPRWVASEPFI